MNDKWRDQARQELRVEYPPCVGYFGKCDGDLVATPHEPHCPRYGKVEPLWPQIAVDERAKRLAAEFERNELRSTLNSLQPRTFPMNCDCCNGVMNSTDDYEWHGIGNCVPICETCGGAGFGNAVPL